MTFLIIVFAIALQVFLTVKKLSPFLSLLIVAIVAGFLLGLEPKDLLVSIEKGVGSTLGSVALIITLGAILGKILENSGAAEQIATTLIRKFGEKYIQWAVLLTGFLIGIPLYYNAGFVIMVPLIFSIAKKTRLPLLFIAIPMAASLSTTHCFLPPHPGPVTVIGVLNKVGASVNLGQVLIYGIIIAIPVVILAGPLLGRLVQHVKKDLSGIFTSTVEQEHRILPPAFPSFIIALLPVLLIALAVVAQNILAQVRLLDGILFVGDSTIALLIAVIVAIVYFGLSKGKPLSELMKWLNDAISSISVILLIITAGGVLKQVLTDSGTSAYIASFSSEWQMPPLLFAWIVTALLRVTIGSATVAGITAAGVVAPLAATGTVSPELMVLAVGAGSVFGSHVNDSGFWMFKEFFGLTLRQTFLSWTVMETLISILGLIGVLVLDMFI